MQLFAPIQLVFLSLSETVTPVERSLSELRVFQLKSFFLSLDDLHKLCLPTVDLQSYPFSFSAYLREHLVCPSEGACSLHVMKKPVAPKLSPNKVCITTLLPQFDENSNSCTLVSQNPKKWKKASRTQTFYRVAVACPCIVQIHIPIVVTSRRTKAEYTAHPFSVM